MTTGPAAEHPARAPVTPRAASRTWGHEPTGDQSQPSALSPQARDDALGDGGPDELDVLVVGGGVVGAARRWTRSPAGSAQGCSSSATRPAAPAAAAASWSTAACATWRCSTSVWSARRCRSGPAADPDRPAPGAAGAVPLPVDRHRWERPYVGRGAGPLRRHGDAGEVFETSPSKSDSDKISFLFFSYN